MDRLDHQHPIDHRWERSLFVTAERVDLEFDFDFVGGGLWNEDGHPGGGGEGERREVV
jgi:hypothetical protein